MSAVLVSGGLDSVVLLLEEAAHGDAWPLYVSAGLAWEAAERRALAALLAAPPLAARASVHPLTVLTLDMSDVYPPAHWAVAGAPPAYHTPDEDVYLPGRNIVLTAKAAVFCALHGIDRLVLGTLDRNPFPDATPEFRRALQSALTLGLGRALQIAAPYADRTKADVIRRGVQLGVPLELTLSCMDPRAPDGRAPRHCGLCSKCRERHDAFRAAGMADPTDYAATVYTG
jgi:7-cyano-7-deazaguanine synthase